MNEQEKRQTAEILEYLNNAREKALESSRQLTEAYLAMHNYEIWRITAGDVKDAQEESDKLASLILSVQRFILQESG